MYLPVSGPITPPPTPVSDTLARLEAQQELILREMAEAAKHRQFATIAGIAGAVFAALRLGIVALPTLSGRFRKNPCGRRRY